MKLKFQITGMSCDHCVRSIEESVNKLAGVEQVHVIVGEADITFDEARIDKSDLIEAIRTAGSFDISGFTVCD